MRLKLVGNVFCAVMIAAISATSILCNRRDPNIPKVDSAVRLFNGRFNTGRFHEIYANSHPSFQQAVSEDEFTAKLAGLLQEHGPIQSSGINGVEDMTRWQRLFPESKATRFIGVCSRCKNGALQEFFTFNVLDDEARLLQFGTSLEELNKNLRH